MVKEFISFLVFAWLCAVALVTSRPLERRATQKGMHVQGSQLLDGNGQEFVFRGINISHAWFSDKTEFSIKEVAALGANSARIVLACGAKYSKTSYQEVEKIIGWCEGAGLVCVLELHDFTGSDNPSDITSTAVNYWKEMKDLVNAHKDYIIVNIANEWQGSWNMGSLWGDTYASAIKSMRSIGIQNAIMVDASGYGQETGPMIDSAQRVLSADPQRNVIFSYHVYSVLGRDDQSLYAGFDGIQAKGVCWMVGEFGWWQNGGDVVYKSLMSYCRRHKIGWMAWSWSGNSGIDTCLDLTSSNSFSRNDLSEWGKYVFYSSDGIQSTSQKAYRGSGNEGVNEGGDVDYLIGDPFCHSCTPTSTGGDGSLWGWEEGRSCRIDYDQCGLVSERVCSTCVVTTTGGDGSLWGWEDGHSCRIHPNKCGLGSNSGSNSDSDTYCNSCTATSTGGDGSLWGWENDRSCRIDISRCGGGGGGNGKTKAPNGYSYCDGCQVTYAGGDGIRWGWENNQSCVINNNKC